MKERALGRKEDEDDGEAREAESHAKHLAYEEGVAKAILEGDMQLAASLEEGERKRLAEEAKHKVKEDTDTESELSESDTDDDSEAEKGSNHESKPDTEGSELRPNHVTEMMGSVDARQAEQRRSAGAEVATGQIAGAVPKRQPRPTGH